ncbi:hypothetical protein [Pseudobacteroides cellulosolvens]|uniref:Uncharacterized protein n=1 Tax=Pseudobacteroides cellulosolvens ATCC 35603 = DSM 2933 TaxID=398512 RepID=A0A0L6JJM8_9FIRM|nr:hypothetical protein [Pseudobacteroides cellulosolvens]KNY25964.1 hypothetical protein Bccel_1224 [Pseudobacteroides cellulosolvens ATCC 35603 = DSM 2933]
MSISLIMVELLAGTDVIWYFGDFFTTVYMTEITKYHINILFIAVLAIALLYGLEAVARARVAVYSGIVYKDVPYQVNWDMVVRSSAAITFGFILPAVLLVVALVRKKLNTKNKPKKE